MTEDHMQRQHVIDHVIEDYDPQYHITTEDHVKDHPDRQHKTSN